MSSAMKQHVIDAFKEVILGWNPEIQITNVFALKTKMYEGFDRSEVDTYLRTMPKPDINNYAMFCDGFLFEEDFILYHICKIVHRESFFKAYPNPELSTGTL